jgi:CDP-diacylglycerol--serine O-phosphatidyltransferase
MIKYLSIADIFSISNGIFGVFSIIVIITNIINYNSINLRIHISLTLILSAIIFDGLDGIIARGTWKSEIGEYLDSLADMTSLIIAPSIFIYFIYSDDISFCIYRQIYIFIALILFISFGIIRLASFNLMKKDNIFIGLPAPASTIILLMISFIKIEYIFVLPAIIIIAALMASEINYPRPGIKIYIITFILIVFTIILGKSCHMIFPIFLLSAILIYVIIGPFFVKFLIKNNKNISK